MVDDVYFFGDSDVPDEVKSLRTWRVAERIGHAKCFYTGVECEFQLSSNHRPWTASTEHLLASSDGGFRSRQNIVLACSIANSTIGSAPLPVKLEVKQTFDRLALDPLTKNSVKNLIMTIIGKYSVCREDGKMIVPAWDGSITDTVQQAEANNILRVLRDRERQYLDNPLSAFREEI